MEFIKHFTLIAALIGSGHFVQAVQPFKQEAIEWAFITAGLNTGRQLLLTWHYVEEAPETDTNNCGSSSEEDSELEALAQRYTNPVNYGNALRAMNEELENRVAQQDAEIARLEAQLADLQNEGTSQDGLDLAAIERGAIDDFYECIDSGSEDDGDSIDSEALEAELESLKDELAAAAKWMNKNA